MTLHVTITAAESGFTIQDADDGRMLAGCSTMRDVCDWLCGQAGEEPRDGETAMPRVVSCVVSNPAPVSRRLWGSR